MASYNETIAVWEMGPGSASIKEGGCCVDDLRRWRVKTHEMGGP